MWLCICTSCVWSENSQRCWFLPTLFETSFLLLFIVAYTSLRSSFFCLPAGALHLVFCEFWGLNSDSQACRTRLYPRSHLPGHQAQLPVPSLWSSQVLKHKDQGVSLPFPHCHQHKAGPQNVMPDPLQVPSHIHLKYRSLAGSPQALPGASIFTTKCACLGLAVWSHASFLELCVSTCFLQPALHCLLACVFCSTASGEIFVSFESGSHVASNSLCS